MILHCTRKLSSRLPEISETPLSETSPLGSWHAHLVTFRRRQCALFCHDRTRYLLFMPGLKKEHFADLGRLHRELFLMSLAALGLRDAQIGRAALALGPAVFDSATDRSVLSSMNIGMRDLEDFLFDVPNLMEIDPVAIATLINDRPLSIRGDWLWAEKEMVAQVENL